MEPSSGILPVNVVQGSIDIGTITAVVNVALDASGATPDSVRVSDGTDTLLVNADGSINVTVTSGGGGGTVNQGTPAVTANAWPIKLTDGTDTADITASSALKVDGSAVTQPVSGTVAVSGSVAVTGPLTDAQLRAAAVPVSGTFFQATQPVSAASLPLPTGAATEATLLTRTKPADTQIIGDGGGSITVDGTVGVSGSVAVTGPLTDAQLRAVAVPVSGTFFQATQPVSGTVTANAGSGTFAVSAATLPLPTGAATSALQTQPGVDIGDVTVNNGAGAAAVNIQDGGNAITVDGDVTANVFIQDPALSFLDDTAINTSGILTSISNIDDAYVVVGASMAARIAIIGGQLDDTATTVPSENATGALRITAQRGVHTNLRNVSGTEVGVAAAPLRTDPTGTTAQPVTDNGGSLTVDGTVSISGSVAVTGPLTDAQLRAATVPISGTVTANAGSGTFAVSAASLPLPAGAATSALQTQPGVDIGDVTINNAAGAAAVNVQDGGNSITVDSAQLPAALVGARLDTNVGAWLGSTAPTVGQKTAVNSLPVVIASDQTAVPTNSRVTLTGSAPTAVSVGVASAAAVASNASRKGLVLVNTSSNKISFGLNGNAAVLNSGITLNALGGVWVMDEYTFTTGAIAAIAAGAASNLSVQELT